MGNLALRVTNRILAPESQRIGPVVNHSAPIIK